MQAFVKCTFPLAAKTIITTPAFDPATRKSHMLGLSHIDLIVS